MKKAFVGIIMLLSMFSLVNFVSAAQCPEGQICNFLSVGSFKELLLKIAGGVGILVAALGTVMILVAGILYLISAGSPEKMQTAKKALIYAVVGIAIGLAAKSIVEIIEQTIGTTN